MIKSVKYLPTVFKVTPRAKDALAKSSDDALMHLGYAALRSNFAENQQAKSSFLSTLKNIFRPTSRLHVFLDVRADNQFVLNTARRFKQYHFLGDSVVVDLAKFAKSKKSLIDSLVKSKDGILDDLRYLKALLK